MNYNERKATLGNLGIFHPDYGRYWVADVPYLAREVECLINAGTAV